MQKTSTRLSFRDHDEEGRTWLPRARLERALAEQAGTRSHEQKAEGSTHPAVVRRRTMIARIARWNPFPDTPWVPDVGTHVAGIHALYHLVDDESGEGLSITIADDDDAIDRATSAIVAANVRRGPEGFVGGPAEVRSYRVHAASTSTTTSA
jgi:transposase InsO family protein